MQNSAVKNFIIESIIRIIRFFAMPMSVGLRSYVGVCLGKIARAAMKNRFNISIENLKRAFPEKDNNWYVETAKKSFDNIGITFFETLTLDTFNINNIHKIIKFVNIELLSELISRGKGALLMSAHFSNWELLAYSATLFTKKSMLIVVKRQKYADKLINKIRTSSGNDTVEMGSAARSLIKWLSEGKPAAMLADQSATSDRDIFIDFFGVPAATYKAPAELALRFGIPVVFGIAYRGSDGIYTAEIKEIKHDDLKYNSDGVKELMRRYNAELEYHIAKYPEQWAWQHKRWKHTPSAS